MSFGEDLANNYNKKKMVFLGILVTSRASGGLAFSEIWCYAIYYICTLLEICSLVDFIWGYVGSLFSKTLYLQNGENLYTVVFYICNVLKTFSLITMFAIWRKILFWRNLFKLRWKFVLCLNYSYCGSRGESVVSTVPRSSNPNLYFSRNDVHLMPKKLVFFVQILKYNWKCKNK